MKFAEIIIPINNKNVDRIFHYSIPINISEKIDIGMRVIVPFGKSNKQYDGFVIGFSDKCDVPLEKIKSIIAIKDKCPIFSQNMISLAFWMKNKYYTTLSECLKCIMPNIVNEKKVKYAYINKLMKLDIQKCILKNNQQSRVLQFLLKFDGTSLDEIKMFLGITISPIKSLEEKNLIYILDVEKKRDVFNIEDFKHTSPFIPNEEQKAAIDFAIKNIDITDKKPILIHGVTGSGKTEIYLQIIEEVINKGKQAIILVPEISLTPQTVSRFIGRFGNKVSVTHSRLSYGERFDQWKKAKDGDISVMIGPRSAIFTPFQNLGAIIIDEEHESTYKSETTPKYDAREIAEKLSEITNCLVILGSATPSVNSFYKSEKGDYNLITIKKRINQTFPDIHIVDMRKELEAGNKMIFSKSLFEAMNYNLLKGQQTILFLNRRGHSTFVSCRKCGYVMECSECNVNYTYHMSINKLICHYCGKTIENPSICPTCGSKYIKYFGIGTQKVEEEVSKIFPEARVIRMDMDTTSRKNSHEAILKKFASGDADILVGTQMIAKGLDFPNVSLVGIIAADLSLNAGDFRCAENTFQLLTQVSGRAGRAKIKGSVFIQTYNPKHYSIEFAKQNNYNGFYKHEISVRRQMMYPPFSNIFFIMFISDDEKKIIKTFYVLIDIMNKFNKNNQFEYIGPAPAVISKIKKKYRWKIIVKAVSEENLKNYVLYCMDKLEKIGGLNGITVNMTMNPSYIP